MQWLNPPAEWSQEGSTITARANADTDFWRKTHYGFIRDDGHFFYQEVRGDFIASVKCTGDYATLYDQAGLMLRENETTWMKCGIEYVGEMQQASCVITRDYSDWSVVPLPQNPRSIDLRVKRAGGTLEVFYSLDAHDYTMIRTAHLSDSETLMVGPMCAAPKGQGFTVTFEDFKIETHS